MYTVSVGKKCAWKAQWGKAGSEDKAKEPIQEKGQMKMRKNKLKNIS